VKQDEKESKAGAIAAGAGGGTLLAVVANTLPESNPAKPWLLLCAPSASIFLSAMWLWAQRQIILYLRDREFRTATRRLIESLEQALDNTRTSPEHRDELRRRLEQVQLVTADKRLEEIRALNLFPTDPDKMIASTVKKKARATS